MRDFAHDIFEAAALMICLMIVGATAVYVALYLANVIYSPASSTFQKIPDRFPHRVAYVVRS